MPKRLPFCVRRVTVVLLAGGASDGPAGCRKVHRVLPLVLVVEPELRVAGGRPPGTRQPSVPGSVSTDRLVCGLRPAPLRRSAASRAEQGPYRGQDAAMP